MEKAKAILGATLLPEHHHVSICLKQRHGEKPVALSMRVTREGPRPETQPRPESKQMRVESVMQLQKEEEEENKKKKWHPARELENMLVEVHRDGDGATFVTVIVDRNDEDEKPYRGGFRDRRNGSTYLNAAAQTTVPWPAARTKTEERLLKITRETQKSWMRNCNKQTVKEAFTQMKKSGASIDDFCDVELLPGPYMDSAEWEARRHAAATLIQKYVRRSIAKRTADRMRLYAKEKREFFAERARKKKEQYEKKLRYEIGRRINPRSGADFEILYQELETWRLQEMKAINTSGCVGLERKKFVKELLLKELKLIQVIDKLRTKAAKLNRVDRITKTMVRMGKPKIWEMSNGNIVHVQTTNTTHALDLMNLYKALERRVESMDERMGVLGYVKWTVQVHNSPLTREILMLVEREADLMYRGRPAHSLSGLRQRILGLFVQYVETPEFNPEAMHYQFVPADFDYMKNRHKHGVDTPTDFF
ncbi:unnamed protein product [Sphagnum troendelagicum]|uniref:IQ motif and ubiquitin-like domain-containing protein n=1 Tax=Sphagnum troendelagicum TaxID=128251 RepID=A0ABP0UMK4_9BRYO